jgi:hypothetical protein
MRYDRTAMAILHRLWLLATILIACSKGEQQQEDRKPPEKPRPVAKPAPVEPTAPVVPANDGPRYLRPNNKGELVDAFKFPSVPADIVEKEIATASTRADAAGILRRFGLPLLEGKTGTVWIGKASLVDRLARERVLVVSFRSDASDGMRDEDDWVVFLGSTEDDRVLKIGNFRIKAKTPDETPVEVDARELHSKDRDDVVATWSSCTPSNQKACHYLRAWTMQRGYPEMIADVAGDTKPTIADLLAPPHSIVVDGRVIKYDASALAYR